MVKDTMGQTHTHTEATLAQATEVAGSVFNSPFSRRIFFAGMAAVSGSGLWSSISQGTAGAQSGGSLEVGRGMADMTGEPWGAGMNGYAVLEQSSIGLQRRQYARSFIFVDPNSGQRVVHCTADVGLMFQSIHLEVLRRLKAKFGDLYGQHNVLLHAQHTHIAPGGTSAHLMVDITVGGFRPITFEANVSGIVDSIVRAHDDIQPSDNTLSRAEVLKRQRESLTRGLRQEPAGRQRRISGGHRSSGNNTAHPSR